MFVLRSVNYILEPYHAHRKRKLRLRILRDILQTHHKRTLHVSKQSNPAQRDRLKRPDGYPI